jgi:hypothetical protein
MYLGVIVRQLGSFVHVKTLLRFKPTPVEFIVKTTFIASIED